MRRKLSDEVVKKIYAAYHSSNDGRRSLAEYFGVSEETITAIGTGRSWWKVTGHRRPILSPSRAKKRRRLLKDIASAARQSVTLGQPTELRGVCFWCSRDQKTDERKRLVDHSDANGRPCQGSGSEVYLVRRV